MVIPPILIVDLTPVLFLLFSLLLPPGTTAGEGPRGGGAAARPRARSELRVLVRVPDHLRSQGGLPGERVRGGRGEMGMERDNGQLFVTLKFVFFIPPETETARERGREREREGEGERERRRRQFAQRTKMTRRSYRPRSRPTLFAA